MCNSWCIDFVKVSMEYWPKHPDILEVGSLNVNGSPRDVCQGKYKSYTGVDITPGFCVDQVVSVEDLPNTDIKKADVVISTEMLEHVHDWKIALFNLLFMLKDNGVLVLTTRSPGFEYHPYPEDNWRFVVKDFEHLFDNSIFPTSFKLVHAEPDPDLRNGVSCGVGIIVQKIGYDLKIIQERINSFDAYNMHTHRG